MNDNSDSPAESSDTPSRRAGGEPLKEVSAATIGRMLGLATTSDLKLLEGKLDLIATKLTNVTVKLEKVVSSLSNTPTGGDLERIDVQIGMLRTLILESMGAKPAAAPPRKPAAMARTLAEEKAAAREPQEQGEEQEPTANE